MKTELLKMLINEGRITDNKIKNAFEKVDPTLFIPAQFRETYLKNKPVLFYWRETTKETYYRTVSQPSLMAAIISELNLKRGYRILILGTKSGYPECIIAELVGPRGLVYVIEVDKDVATHVEKLVIKAGYPQVRVVVVGDILNGEYEFAPWDRILITGQVEEIPSPLLRQLTNDGFIIAPVGDRNNQKLLKVNKRGDEEIIAKVIFSKLVANEQEFAKREDISKLLPYYVTIQKSGEYFKYEIFHGPDCKEWEYQPRKNIYKETIERLNQIIAPESNLSSKNITHESIDKIERFGKFLFDSLLHHEFRKTLFEIEEGSNIILKTNMNDIPWELIYKEEFLALRYLVGRASLKKGSFERVTGQPKEINTLLVAGTTSNEVIQEIKKIKQYLEKLNYNVYSLEGEDATAATFCEQLTEGFYDIIHYAGEAEFNSRRPEESKLYLHDKSYVTAEQLFNIIEGERKIPQLVFLNACEVAKTSKNISGLLVAFINAGVKTAVGPLWEVNSKSAAEFAIGFYEYIFKGYCFGEAIRRVRRDILKKLPDPTHTWAAFVLYGDPTELLTGGKFI